MTAMLILTLTVSMILGQRAYAVRELYRDAAPADAEGYDWR